MSKSFVVRAFSSAVTLLTVVAFMATTPVFALETSTSDRIAQAKAKIWGEYPKVDQAYREVIRPVIAVVAPTETKVGPVKAAVKTEAKAKAAVKAVTKTTPVKAEAQAEVEAKTEEAVQAEAPVAAPAKVEEVAPVVEVKTAVVQAVAEVQAPVEAAPVASTGDAWIDEIVRLTNEARQAEGIKPLSINATLNQAAAIRVAELPSSPSPHLRPDGAAFYTVFAEVGLTVKVGGENYAVGTANAYSPEQIVNAWLASPGHRKNIMNASYTKIGVGHGIFGDKEYFEQLFTA